MRIFSSILGVALLAFVVCFALSNPQVVMVGLWPVEGTVETPLYFVGLVPLGAGLIVGGVVGWLYGLPHRFRARRLNKELAALTEQIGALQKDSVAMPAESLPKKRFWERKI